MMCSLELENFFPHFGLLNYQILGCRYHIIAFIFSPSFMDSPILKFVAHSIPRMTRFYAKN